MTRDVSAIVEALTHEELAHIIARYIESNAREGWQIDTRSIGRGRDIIATATRESSGVVTIEVHEPERASGYYLVYDAVYCQDAVYFWDQAKGHWRSTDHEDSMRRTGQMHVQHWVGPAAGKDDAPQVAEKALPWMPGQANWAPKRLCGCDTPDPAIGEQELVPAEAWLLCKTCRGYFGGPR